MRKPAPLSICVLDESFARLRLTGPRIWCHLPSQLSSFVPAEMGCERLVTSTKGGSRSRLTPSFSVLQKTYVLWISGSIHHRGNFRITSTISRIAGFSRVVLVFVGHFKPFLVTNHRMLRDPAAHTALSVCSMKDLGRVCG